MGNKIAFRASVAFWLVFGTLLCENASVWCAKLNSTSAGISLVTALDGLELESDRIKYNEFSESGSDGMDDVVTEIESAHPSIDSILQWALGNSDPEKLREVAKQVQQMNPEDVQKRRLEIKELMEKLKVPSDAELMKVAIVDLQNDSVSLEGRLHAMKELLILVEPIDNSNDLNKLGGVEAIIKELDQPETELRLLAAWVIGTACQNNPTVQQQILNQGGLPKLMKMVQSSNVEEAVKALYAVSAVIRNLASAQELFHREGGTQLLQYILDNVSVDPRLRRKSLFLLADLAEQQVEMGGQLSIGVHEGLLKTVVSLVESPDLDTQEKALEAVRSMIKMNSAVRDIVLKVCHAEAVLERVRLSLLELMLDPERGEFVKDIEALRQEVALSLARQESDEGFL